MRFLIRFSYDGTSYSGFQTQKGKNTIQEKLENALMEINNHQKTIVVATGRTDKGVHALSQFAHADLQVNITEAKLKRALNSHLPEDIHVIETKIVEDSFHARYQVREKTYVYTLNMGEYNPLERNTVFQYNYSLNVENMRIAISCFLGTHDFRSFVTDNKEKDNCVRTITKALIKEKNQKLEFIFSGNGFLRYQVRNMVGILIRVGEGKISPEKVSEILECKDRTKFGRTAPPEGLCLVDVKY